MTAMACRKKSIIGNHFSDLVKQGDPGITKYAKRIQPFTIHHVNSDFDTKIEPLLISHQLSNILIPGIESPLASIYHQLEVTFNFGHKYDEVKAKIPFLVSTVPYSSKLADIAFDRELAPRYSIETQAHQLPIYVDVQNNPKDKKSERRNTVLTETYYQSQSDECLSLRPSLSDNQLRSSSSYDSFEFGNPRKAVNGPKQKLLHPIDVELANRLLLNTSNRSSPFSQQSNQQNIPKKNARHSLAGLAPPPRSGRIREAIPEPKAPVNDSLSSFEDDMGSVYSDVSLGSRIAPSLTSSGTDSSGLLSLHSRPVSPPANVAPGLPATVTLRPQDDNHASLIEERFAAVNSTDPNSLSSPIQTVASSSVFTPRTTYAMMCQYYSNLQVPDRPQSMSSSTLNSPPGTENSSLFFYSNHIMAETHFTPLNANQYVSAELPPLPTEFAAGEEPAITRQNLPPIPGVSPTTTAFTDNTNNTHAYYRDESDEEEEEEEGGSISLSVSSPQLPQLPQLPEAAMPPQLPRLSLGHTFAFSLE
jgi:hypothetical protein